MGDLFEGLGTALVSGVGVFALFLLGVWTATEARNIRLRRKLRKEGRVFVPTGLMGLANSVLNRYL